MEYQEEQKAEIEALLSIYEGEIESKLRIFSDQITLWIFGLLIFGTKANSRVT